MAVQATLNVVGAAASNPVVMNREVATFAVSVGVTVVSGSVNYTLQYTYDDPFQAGGISTWWDYPTMSSLTAQADVILNGGPVTAVRVVNAGTGTLQARVLQAGS